MEVCLSATKPSIRLDSAASISAALGRPTGPGTPSGAPSTAVALSSFVARLPLQKISWGRFVASDSGRAVAPVRAQDNSAATNRVRQSYSNYAVPSLENQSSSSFIKRPLAEILRDMNKRVPDKVLKTQLFEGVPLKFIPWFHANRMLSFYAPGWSGEVRNITFSADSTAVSVVYRVTIRGSDGEAWREASGTALLEDELMGDPVQKAEGLAFCRACARFGLGLYLYHEDDTTT